jgi:hypothetical protein
MTDAFRVETRKPAIAESVRSRITHLQERIGQLETGARGRISRALTTGNAKLRELDKTLAEVSRDDWTVAGVRRQIDQLRARAGTARANALKRVAELPGTAVVALATGTRAPVQNLANGIAGIAKRIEVRPNGPTADKLPRPKATNGK